MTTCAYREVVVSKRTLPVMTAHTTKRTCPRVVIERLWCGHFLLNATAHAMTSLTTQTLIPIVLFVTEADPEGSGHLVWADVATEFMAHAA